MRIVGLRPGPRARTTGRLRTRGSPDVRVAVTSTSARREPADLDLQPERVAWQHLAPEPGAVDAPEERKFARVALVSQHGHPTELGQGLDHQHAGQGRTAREMTGEERLVPGEPQRPEADRPGSSAPTAVTKRNGSRWGSKSTGSPRGL